MMTVSGMSTENGYTGEERLVNFPVPVRISTAKISGFRYDKCDGEDDISFSDEDGNILAHEVEVWDTEGESVAWVSLPVMTNNAVFYMNWSHETKLAEVKSNEVWTNANYRAVWHMNEFDATAKTQTDSTGLGNNFTYAGSGGVSTTYAKIGKGFSHNPGATTTANVGSFQNVTDTIKLNFVDGCVLSGWIWWQGFTANNTTNLELLRLNTSSTGSYHWQLVPSDKYLCRKYGGLSVQKLTDEAHPSGWKLGDGWLHWAVRMKRTANNTSDGGQFEYFVNGTPVAKDTVNAKYMYYTGSGAAHLTTGYFKVGGTRGRLDEVRFQNGYMTDEWIKAEYDSVNNSEFVVASPAVYSGTGLSVIVR